MRGHPQRESLLDAAIRVSREPAWERSLDAQAVRRQMRRRRQFLCACCLAGALTVAALAYLAWRLLF